LGFFIKKLFGTNPHKISEINEGEKSLLMAYILLECAMSDGILKEIEIKHIKKLLKKKTDLIDSEIDNVFNLAKKYSVESVEIYSLTKEIRDNFKKNEILEIVQFMWEIVLADKKIDDFESMLMSKATGLFHLTGKESANAKKNAMNSLGLSD